VRAIIVDDEPLGRRAVQQELQRHPEVSVVAECDSVKSSIAAIAASNPDLIFLDIQMPGGDGFDVVEAIGTAARPVVVFLTAYDEYAVRAFRAHAVDYLLKPIDGAQFDEAIRRARSRLSDPGGAESAARVREAIRKLAAEGLRGYAKGRRITVRDAGKVIFLWAGEIDRIAADGNYVRIYTARRNLLVRGTLQNMIARLDDSRFARIHKSVVVNADAVSHIKHAGKGLYVLAMRDGSRVESSYHYRHEVMRLAESR
jgi:two-component system LytT family response regulator